MSSALCIRRRLIRLCLQNRATLCTVAKPDPDSVDSSSFGTDKIDPREHTLADVGRFYNIPMSMGFQLFKYGGWPHEYKDQCLSLHDTSLMVRKPGLEVVHYLKNSDYTRPINKYILYGKLGTGRSLVLAYLLHYAHMDGWLLVHLPWVPTILSNPKEVTSSQTEGFVDLNNHASKWLLHFKTQNFNILSENKLVIGNDYQWNIRESSKVGDTLLSVVEYGISRGIYSSDVVTAILKEIKQLSINGVIRTLVAIDGVNALFQPHTKVKNSDRQIIPPEKISFISAFIDLISGNNWNNGAAVFVCDKLAVPSHKGGHLPLELLGEKGFEALFPFIPVEVREYTTEEFKNALDYYRSRLWLGTHDGDEELRILSGCNGYELMKILGPLY